MNKTQYADYLRSKGWIAKRKMVVNRAQNRCQICNQHGYLHVHHRTYERVGDEHPDDLVALCADCHDLYHQYQRGEISIEELGGVRGIELFLDAVDAFNFDGVTMGVNTVNLDGWRQTIAVTHLKDLFNKMLEVFALAYKNGYEDGMEEQCSVNLDRAIKEGKLPF